VKFVVGIAEVVPKMVTDKLMKLVFVLLEPVQIVSGEDLRGAAVSLTLPDFFDTFLFTPKRSFVSHIFDHVF
jgi:hypothetical protein